MNDPDREGDLKKFIEKINGVPLPPLPQAPNFGAPLNQPLQPQPAHQQPQPTLAQPTLAQPILAQPTPGGSPPWRSHAHNSDRPLQRRSAVVNSLRPTTPTTVGRPGLSPLSPREPQPKQPTKSPLDTGDDTNSSPPTLDPRKRQPQRLLQSSQDTDDDFPPLPSTLSPRRPQPKQYEQPSTTSGPSKLSPLSERPPQLKPKRLIETAQDTDDDTSSQDTDDDTPLPSTLSPPRTQPKYQPPSTTSGPSKLSPLKPGQTERKQPIQPSSTSVPPSHSTTNLPPTQRLSPTRGQHQGKPQSDESSSTDDPFDISPEKFPLEKRPPRKAVGGSPSSKSSSSPSQRTQNLPQNASQQNQGQAQKASLRLQLKEDAGIMVANLNDKLKMKFTYADKSKNEEKLKACGASKKSRVTAILSKIEKTETTYEATYVSYAEARTMAKEYIAAESDSKDADTIKRVKLCREILNEIEEKLSSLEGLDTLARKLAGQYLHKLQDGKEVPFEAAESMKVLLERKLLPVGTKKMLQTVMDAITKVEKSTGYAAIQNLQANDHRGKAELLNRHGCFKASDGGTSDVRLLENKDGTIAFAYKSVEGESNGGLSFLNLPKGASSMREDVSSTICKSIKEATALDLGFPESSIVNLDGEAGAAHRGGQG